MELTRSAKLLSGVEARRMIRGIWQHVAQRIIDLQPMARIPKHLVTTVSTGEPSDNPDVYHESRLPELDPRTHAAVNDCIMALPVGARQFVWHWYRRKFPPTEMARERHMSVRQLGREWQRILVMLRERFLAHPHADLVKLVRSLP
jgi:hypothetical protein